MQNYGFLTTYNTDENMKRRYTQTRSRKGMALLVVLFIVMAIAIISSGFIARSDASMMCGRNYCVRTETDYLAWGGMEHAWAVVQDPNVLTSTPFELTAQQLDVSSDQYYDLTIDTPVETVSADPNDPSTFTYPVECSAYKQVGGESKAASTLHGTLFHDPAGSTYYISITR